jgi:beta-lactamase superfamily II metal-dependent hydrolase
MRIDIHNVGHGHCSVITCPNGAKIMLDCGYQADPGWFPSITYGGQRVALLAFTNLDEDHVEDLPYVWKDVPLGAVFSNPTVTAGALTTMKRAGGMGRGVSAAHTILGRFGAGVIGTLPDLGEVYAWAYYNRYGVDFTDTNNLSLAIIVRYRGVAVLFAGDLETAGWRTLLRNNPYFAHELASVRVMVASHHGRANGQCDELFRLMRPDVVVFSDDAKQYESQETDAWYRRRVSGIPDHQNPRPLGGYGRRHVLTTRRDGTLTMQVDDTGRYFITPERHSIAARLPQWPTPLSNLGFPAPTPLWARLT